MLKYQNGVIVMEMSEVFSDYYHKLDSGTCFYMAGINRYTRNFSRDVFISGILAAERHLLYTQLEFAANNQGEKNECDTGEMPGRIHHELPGVPYRIGNQLTTYNACDTTGLFLISAEGLAVVNPEAAGKFLKSRLNNVVRAIGHIAAHTDDSHLFREYPPPGTNQFALRVTYWKDSILANPEGKEEPVYPIFIPQAHFIAARGLLSAGRLLKDKTMTETAGRMFVAGIKKSINESSYLAYEDATETRLQPSSDELHSLAYIPAEYADLLPLKSVSERADEYLRTPFGYVCTPKEVSDNLSDNYHGYKVWVFEQALINYGATKFGLIKNAAVAARIAPLIGQGQELFDIKSEGHHKVAQPLGDNRQLWSVAADEYFAGRSILHGRQWL